MRDIEKHKEVCRKHYLRNKVSIIKNTGIRNERRRIFIRQFLRGYKSFLGCSKCPITDFRVLDFHHLKNKQFTVSNMRYNSILKVLQEIENCVVLCSNCHRIETFEQRN